MAKYIDVANPILSSGKHYITCDWGYYSDGKTFHKGIDLAPESSSITPDILAYADGVVIATGNVNGTNKSNSTAGCGTYVAIKHSDGTITRYQHMMYNSLKVKKGDSVKKGQILGKYGRPTTGNSTGAHLHYDVSLPTKPSGESVKATFCGEARYYVNPKPYLQKITKTETKAYVVTASALNVRSGAGMNYSVVEIIHQGCKVTISETRNGFGKIGNNRWISMSYVKEA